MNTPKANESIERFGNVLVNVPANPRAEVVYWCQWAVHHQNRFRYTMTSQRSEMFNHFADLVENQDAQIHADCSQFAAALLHHVGNREVTNLDWTGTLLKKGTEVSASQAKAADVIIFGGGDGEHAAIKTYNGFCIGFGHWPGAPNRQNIVTFADWFASHGHPGVRYISFLP